MRKLLLAIFTLAVTTFPEVSCAELLVIAHPDIAVRELATSQLKKVYLNRSKRWDNGDRIHLTILVGEPATALFISKYLGKSRAQFDRYWKRQLFSGKGIPPEYFKSLQELIHYIQTTKGAIGFVDCTTPPQGVAVIRLLE